MSVVIVAGGRRWPLRHGQDPVDLLAEQGLTGQPVRSVLGADGCVEVHYAVEALDEAVPGPELGMAGRGATVLRRVAAYALVLDGAQLLVSRLAAWVGGGAGGLWTLPGGGVDPYEEPRDAVVREVHEETGQHVEVGDLVQVQSTHHVDADEDFHAVRLVYLAHCPQPQAARVVEIDGSTGAAAWVSLDRLSDLPQTAMIGTALPHLPAEVGRAGAADRDRET
ncbi:NUDIX hydrolase [Janibacter alittae]|uniref:NUDIX domain-containing protein n=1 Tax=Janibacter alittae TaxID=3115209 RepID=A0ABZ2MF73_9MICO